MKLCFTLTMPGNNSWNGKWSGDGKLFAIIKDLPPSIADPILAKRSFGYSFGDGWFARVSVKEIQPSEIADIKKNNNGFCGYDWVVDSIIATGEIKTEVLA